MKISLYNIRKDSHQARQDGVLPSWALIRLPRAFPQPLRSASWRQGPYSKVSVSKSCPSQWLNLRLSRWSCLIAHFQYIFQPKPVHWSWYAQWRSCCSSGKCNWGFSCHFQCCTQCLRCGHLQSRCANASRSCSPLKEWICARVNWEYWVRPQFPK